MLQLGRGMVHFFSIFFVARYIPFNKPIGSKWPFCFCYFKNLAVRTFNSIGEFVAAAKIGQPIVAYAILKFVIMLITGLILWWPKRWNKTNIKKSITIKRKASFKRVTYDLHNVFGFYSYDNSISAGINGPGIGFWMVWKNVILGNIRW